MSAENTDISTQAPNLQAFLDIFTLQQHMEVLNQQDVIQNMGDVINIGNIIESVKKRNLISIPHKNIERLIIQAIFYRLAQSNSYSKKIISNVPVGDEKNVIKGIGRLTSRLCTVECNDNKSISDYCKAVKWRNFEFKLDETGDPWATCFFDLIFKLPDEKTNILVVPKEFEVNSTQELLAYLANYAKEIERQNIYHTLAIPASIQNPISLLVETLNNKSLPFGKFKIALSNENIIAELEQLTKLQEKAKIDELHIEFRGQITEEKLKELTTLVQKFENNSLFTIRLVFSNVAEQHKEKITKLQNQIEKNRRSQNKKVEIRSAKDEIENENKSGKIATAIINSHQAVNNIAISQQNQQQQSQQQQNQQQQQSLNRLREGNGDTPTEPAEKILPPFDGDEADLIHKSDVDWKLSNFVEEYSKHTATQCWNAITGKDSLKFWYGIKYLTKAAAKQLIQAGSMRDGFHPDHLLPGFLLMKHKDGHFVLAYDPTHPLATQTVTPFTYRDEIPIPDPVWKGDMLQFLNDSSIDSLVTETQSKDKSKEIITFFGLQSNENLALSKGLLVIKALLKAQCPKGEEIFKQLTDLFGDGLNSDNLKAFAEIIYAGDLHGLQQLLEALQALKEVKDSYFAHFKKCFIDPLKNWNELVTPEALDALSGMRNFSAAQLNWWEALTEDHGLASPGSNNKNERRYIGLASCYSVFNHFQAKLNQCCPGASLPPKFPCKRPVPDMRVDLARLSTILENAVNPYEQLSLLNGISLDAFGPFYFIYTRSESFLGFSKQAQTHQS